MDDILIDDFPIPRAWRRAYAFDVGWKKTAVLWGAVDAESDTVYFYSEHYQGAAEPALHASTIKSRGDWIPGCVDPSANGRSQKDGEQLIAVYMNEGLNLINANNAVDAGIHEVWNRLSTGRIRVFRKSCPNWQQEFPLYHRDEKGVIVKKRDHLMDCMRYFMLTGIQIAAYQPSTRLGKPARRGWRTV